MTIYDTPPPDVLYVQPESINSNESMYQSCNLNVTVRILQINWNVLGVIICSNV